MPTCYHIAAPWHIFVATLKNTFMKKLFAFALCASLAACANNGNGTDSNGADSIESVQTPAVPNVNGNIPDTTNSITLNGVPDTAQAPNDTTRR